MVYLEGVIFDSKTINEHLKMYADDSRVKAILLRMDTPGGGVAASQEIADQVKWLRNEKNKTVVVSMGSVGASGGYYVACAANKIYANPGTVTGSIGVIAEWVNYGNLLKWAQMKSEVIKSGELTLCEAGWLGDQEAFADYQAHYLRPSPYEWPADELACKELRQQER